MGKGNLILGTGRGKLGDAVFYRAGGEQRYRLRVKPTNPRTDAQIVQRIVTSTAVKFYSEVISVCDHAFQGYEGAMKNQQRFMKLNIDLMRKMALQQVESWSPLKLNWAEPNGNWNYLNSMGVMINPYQISEGDLPSVPVTLANPKGGSKFVLYGMFGDDSGNQETFRNMTYTELANFLGLNVGDQLTFVVCRGNEVSTDNIFKMGEIRQTLIGRVILAPKEGDPSEVKVFDEDCAFNYADANAENYGDVQITTTYGSGLTKENEQCMLMVYAPELKLSLKDVAAFGIIVSRKENGKWRRSTSYMTIGGVYNNQSRLGLAIESYNTNDTSSLYLNQANEGKATEETTTLSEETTKTKAKAAKKTTE